VKFHNLIIVHLPTYQKSHASTGMCYTLKIMHAIITMFHIIQTHNLTNTGKIGNFLLTDHNSNVEAEERKLEPGSNR
jgi:hypothetical protein